MECFLKPASPLMMKGVKAVYQCIDIDYHINDLDDLKNIVYDIKSGLEKQTQIKICRMFFVLV